MKKTLLLVAAMLVAASGRAQTAKPISKESSKPRCEGGGRPTWDTRPWIKFKNANGKVVKEIKAGDKDYPRYIRRTRVWGCTKGDYGTALLVDIDNSCWGEDCYDLRGEPRIDFYSANGKLLWSKTVQVAGELIFTSSSKLLAVSADDRRVWLAGYLGQTLFVEAFDEKGREKRFVLKDWHNPHQLGISDNGRYAWSRGTIKTDIIRFFDLETDQTHDYMGNGYPEITDDGLAQVRVNSTQSHPGPVVDSYQFK